MQDEKTLVNALKEGERVAFEKIFRLYNKKVYLFCYSILHQKEEAENITQDVFIKLWAIKETIDPEKSFSGFLFTIARNMTFYHIRAEIHRQIIIHEAARQKKMSLNPVESKVSFNELKQSLANLIAQLPPKRREIFLLSREEGLSHLEISKRLNISIHTVESQISKALKFIRKSLGQFTSILIFL